MDEDWHVYWRNPGGTGLPTKIQWKPPQGYKVGRTEFPVPELKFDKILKETSFVHEGTALFLTPVQVPTSIAPGGTATFKASVSWLACKKNCIPGNCELSLTLPVVAPTTETKLANTKQFEEARDALPTPAAKAEHIKLSGSADTKTITPGKTFTATLTVQIAPKHHMQSHKPFQDYLIPAVLFVEPAEGFDIGEVQYPKAHERKDKMLGKLSEYQGTIAFKMPVEVDEDADTAGRLIRGILQYQICTDSGTCFPPQHVTFEIPVGEGGGESASASGEPHTKQAAAIPLQGSETEHNEGSAPPGSPKEHQAVDTQAAQAPPPVNASHKKSILVRAQDWLVGFGYFGVIIAGLIGGLIMNIMPCVLPVLSLKVLSFVRQANEDRWRIFRLVLAYSAGIMTFYGVLAFLFYRSGTGWGELFQQPVFVIITSAVVMAFALSLFGVFVLFTPKIVNEMGQKVEGEGYLSAFSTGVLATVLGTACTAPFLSAAIAFATKLPPLAGTSIFMAVGLGMSLPIILLTYKPDWLRFVPKPGPWMGVFERLMGFLLLGTVIWILWPLPNQIGGFGLLLSLIFILAVSMAAWIKGMISFGASPTRKLTLYTIAVAITLGGWLLPFRSMSTIAELRRKHNEHEELYARGLVAKYGKNLDWSHGIPWQPYVRDLAMKDVQDGHTLFVDYTAAWCASCKANLAAFIDRPDVIRVMRELNVIPYEADYTNYSKTIKEDLKRFGRAGVPMYLVYKPGDPEHPEVLPEVPTQQNIIDALRRAGPSRISLAQTKASDQPPGP